MIITATAIYEVLVYKTIYQNVNLKIVCIAEDDCGNQITMVIQISDLTKKTLINIIVIGQVEMEDVVFYIHLQALGTVVLQLSTFLYRSFDIMWLLPLTSTFHLAFCINMLTPLLVVNHFGNMIIQLMYSKSKREVQFSVLHHACN